MIQRLTFFCLLSLLCLPLAAQQPDLSTTAEAVVVTGSKTPRRLSEVPQHVTVIDSAEIAQTADLSQLLNAQAGLVINNAYANFGSNRSLFQRNGANAFTLILLDGQPLLDPSALDGAVDLRLLSLDGLRRIEILRGPQAILYGADAVAGVVNLITREPGTASSDPGEPTTSLHLRSAAQTHGTFESAARLNGTSRYVDYRVSVEQFTSNGISEAVPPDSVTTAFDRDGVTRQTLSAGLTVRPVRQLSLRPSVRFSSFDGDFDAGAFQDGANTYENEALFGAVVAEYELPNGLLGGSFSRTVTKRNFDFGAFTSEFEGRASQADAYGSFALGEGGQLTVGTQLRREAIRALLADTIGKVTTVAPYVQLSYGVTEQLRFDAGVRYNYHDAFGGQLNYSLATAFDVSDRLTASLTAASAFQSPTLDQLYGPFGPNPELSPQTSNSLELGLRYRNKTGESQLQLNVFTRRIDEVIVFTNRYNNRDQLTDVGAELTGTARLGKAFQLGGYVSYVRGELQTEDFSGNPVEQDEFFRRPRTTGRLSLTYSPAFPLTARLTQQYTGERPDIYFNPDFSSVTLDLDPYWLTHFYVEYRFLKREQLRVFLDVQNLTDTKFVEVSGFGILGRTLRLGASITL